MKTLLPNNYLSQAKSTSKDIEAFLLVNDLFYKKEYCIDQSPISKGKLRLDFYIPSLNLAIEYDGIQHYQPVAFHKTADSHLLFRKNQFNDNFKNEECLKLGISLIRLPYTLNRKEIFDSLQKCFENFKLPSYYYIKPGNLDFEKLSLNEIENELISSSETHDQMHAHEKKHSEQTLKSFISDFLEANDVLRFSLDEINQELSLLKTKFPKDLMISEICHQTNTKIGFLHANLLNDTSIYKSDANYKIKCFVSLTKEDIHNQRIQGLSNARRSIIDMIEIFLNERIHQGLLCNKVIPHSLLYANFVDLFLNSHDDIKISSKVFIENASIFLKQYGFEITEKRYRLKALVNKDFSFSLMISNFDLDLYKKTKEVLSKNSPSKLYINQSYEKVDLKSLNFEDIVNTTNKIKQYLYIDNDFRHNTLMLGKLTEFNNICENQSVSISDLKEFVESLIEQD